MALLYRFLHEFNSCSLSVFLIFHCRRNSKSTKIHSLRSLFSQKHRIEYHVCQNPFSLVMPFYGHGQMTHFTKATKTQEKQTFNSIQF